MLSGWALRTPTMSRADSLALPVARGKKEGFSNCMTATLAHGQEYSPLQESLKGWDYSPRLTHSSTNNHFIYIYKISCNEDNTTTHVCTYLQDQWQINNFKKTSWHPFNWIYYFKGYLNGPLLILMSVICSQHAKINSLFFRREGNLWYFSSKIIHLEIKSLI